MPEKQTRESIEAELHAGERERLAQQLRELMHEQNETERMFRELEDAAGLPTSQRSKPMTERMAALGMSQAVIDLAGPTEKRTCRPSRRRVVRRRAAGRDCRPTAQGLTALASVASRESARTDRHLTVPKRRTHRRPS